MDIQEKSIVRLRLKEILKANGWTQGQLAAKTGLSITTIGNMQTAKMIRYVSLAALVDATGWPIEKLLEYVPAK